MSNLKTKMQNLAVISSTSVLMTLGINVSATAAIVYDITDLGTLPDQLYTIPNDINDAGQVVGRTGGNGGFSPTRSFFWSQENRITDLGIIPGAYLNYSAAEAINNSGQVVGNIGRLGLIKPNEVNIRAFVWSRETGVRDFGNLLNFFGNINVNDINNAGQVVGSKSAVNGAGRTFLWNPETGVTEFGNFIPNETSNAPIAINNLGQTLVVAYSESGYYFNFLRSSDGSITEINGLPNSDGTDLADINDVGQVVGISTYIGTGPNGEDLGTDDAFISFVRSSNGSIIAIDPIPGYEYTLARGINNLGQVVGQSYSYVAQAPAPAFFWSSKQHRYT
ncbi:hypothetical protein IQ244_05185 [Nostoc sp. LEGE 06077]|uniref:hypothetical protein n=1 Tax=Nostoc sp. LEGE 06077 TaxID=915325 RepID=UPI00187E97D3|nr:hypothetical protein [Nostoc sp. LEGE 06077]MBE9205914.1 hypothetical protein [Nostoc sp. LEGE 06077]